MEETQTELRFLCPLGEHECGINCVHYDRRDTTFISTGSDDGVVKVWNYKEDSCRDLTQNEGYNVNATQFHPVIPILVSAYESACKSSLASLREPFLGA